MAFAIKTPLQHVSWEVVLDVWRTADQIELFESAWTMDHLYPLLAPVDGPQLESWTALAALAMATSRLRLGSMVNGMHFRHPAVTASMAATLDHIAGGRFSLGLGAGWFETEAAATGIELGTMKERFDRFDEGVEVIVRLLTQHATTFSGRYYTLTDAHCEPKPVQQPHPPIVIGGRGPNRTLRTVARWADHWDMVSASSPADWQRLNEVLIAHCEAIGRDPSTILRSVHVMWAADADPRALADQARAFLDVGVNLAIFSMRGAYDARLLEPLAEALRS